MPIEPQLFLSYGRPDSELALAVTAELWRNRIECYNYQVKPIMDHHGFDQDHLKYLVSIKLLVAIVTAETRERELVMQEIHETYELCKAQLRDIPIVYITTLAVLESGPFPTGTTHHEIDPTHVCGTFDRDGAVPIVKELIELMGTEVVARCQKAWDINKRLYAEPWRKNDATLNPAATTAPLPFAQDTVGAVLRGHSMQGFLAGDLAKLSDDNNRWLFLLMLQRVMSPFSLGTTTKEIRELIPRHIQVGPPPLIRAAMHETIPAKTYGKNERIDDVAAVIHAIGHVEQALDMMKCDEAFDIVQRITWPATRRLLMCPIYASAAGLCNAAIRRAICEQLEVTCS
jgi:hypothetical protein